MTWVLFCIFCCTSFSNPHIESRELSLLLKTDKSQVLYEWGGQEKLVGHTIYFFLENSSWKNSIQWFRQNSKALLQIDNSSIKIIYYPRVKNFLGISAQRKYDAKVRAREIKKAMEFTLNGNQTLQLRSTPTRVILDGNRNIGKKLGAPRHRLSALIWHRNTNHFRSFHYLEENPQSFLRTIRRIKETTSK